MKLLLPFSSNLLANQTFWLLSIGFVVILFISLFVFNNLCHLSKRSVLNDRGQARKVVRIYRSANQMDPNFRVLTVPKNRLIRAQIAPIPSEMAEQMFDPTPSQIRQWVNDRHQGQLALRLDEGRWLNVNLKPLARYAVWSIAGFVSIAILMFVAIFLLCGWAIKRLVWPLAEFSKVADRLKMNIHSPLVETTGHAEIDQVIDALNQMRVGIQKIIQDHTQMLAAISHDLRTPITRLKLRAEYLEDSKQYEKIIADLDEMENMVKTFLTFAKEQTQYHVKEHFDLNALLESLCDDLNDVGLKVVYQSDQSQVSFSGSIDSLKRALTNLIDNAVKYGQQAVVRLYLEGKFVVIEIDDEGPGIPEQDLENVFEPFYRLDQSPVQETVGIGLGLAIVKNIIHAHGGDIVLKNRPQGGLRVRIQFHLD
jgi:signal transduction histidine kinase